jgi:hypothetical protein
MTRQRLQTISSFIHGDRHEYLPLISRSPQKHHDFPASVKLERHPMRNARIPRAGLRSVLSRSQNAMPGGHAFVMRRPVWFQPFRRKTGFPLLSPGEGAEGGRETEHGLDSRGLCLWHRNVLERAGMPDQRQFGGRYLAGTEPPPQVQVMSLPELAEVNFTVLSLALWLNVTVMIPLATFTRLTARAGDTRGGSVVGRKSSMADVIFGGPSLCRARQLEALGHMVGVILIGRHGDSGQNTGDRHGNHAFDEAKALISAFHRKTGFGLKPRPPGQVYSEKPECLSPTLTGDSP